MDNDDADMHDDDVDMGNDDMTETVELPTVGDSLGDAEKDRCFSYQFGPLLLENASKDAFACFNNIHSDRGVSRSMHKCNITSVC